MAGVTLLDRQGAVRDLESRLRRALLIARLGGERMVSRDGRLEIVRPLGHGASGVVYEGLDRKLGRKVALKLYPGIAHDRLAAAVRTEAQVLAALRHRNIVVVHDFDAAEFRPGDIRCFLVVMELLAGTTLRHWMAQPHPLAAIVDVFCRAGDGLAAAHTREIVHRDFKPENVMLDDDGEPRLVDFGLALLDVPTAGNLDSNDPEQRAIVGTLAYMAPEALRGRAEARSDQFSFAAALWEALHGEFPYRIDEVDPACRVVTPSERSQRLPPALVDCLRRALEPEPGRRFPRMADMLARLRQIQAELHTAPASASRPEIPTGLEFSSDHGRLAIPAGLELSSDHVRSAATTAAPTVARRSLVWLAFPVVGAASIAGVLYALGFWDGDNAEPVADTPTEEPGDVDAPPSSPAQPQPQPQSQPQPQPPSPAPAFTCPDGLARPWLFYTLAIDAEPAKLRGVKGKYDLLLKRSDRAACRFTARLTKYVNDQPSTDERTLTLGPLAPFTAMTRQEFTVGGYTYDFTFLFDGDQLRGDFRAHGTIDKFRGVLQGGLTEADRRPPILADQPCAAQCGVRCRGDRAIARCREQCRPGTAPACDSPIP